jgi:hypothetical protein
MIDIVYTWVDSSDAEWKKLRKIFWNKIQMGDNSDYRFPVNNNSSGELNLSIEVLLKYASWINKIYIIVMRPQKPILDNHLLEKVKLVYHDEIWDNCEYLPVFNSHAIESNIHKIKGLSEKFIYFNDDCYLSDYIYPSDFFYLNMPIIYKCNGDNEKKILSSNITIFDSGHMGSHKNLYKKMGDNYIKYSHHAVPLIKTMCYNSEKYYSDIWKNLSKNKFRNVNEIPPIAGIVSYGKMTNEIIIREKRLVFMTSNVDNYLNSFYNGKFVCINYNDCTKINQIKKKLLENYNKKNKLLKNFHQNKINIEKNDTKISPSPTIISPINKSKKIIINNKFVNLRTKILNNKLNKMHV